MAKEKETNKSGYSGRVFVITGIALFFFIIVTTGMGYALYAGSQSVATNMQQVSSAINEIDAKLLTMNRDVLMIISGGGDTKALVNEISFLYDDIELAMERYEAFGSKDPLENRRYRQAKNFIIAYHEQLLEYQDMFIQADEFNLDLNQARALYIQELHPLQTTSSEMFGATRDLAIKNMRVEARRSARILGYFILTMGLILILGEVVIIIIAGVSKRRAEDLAKREAQVAALDSKVQRSREKINDITNMNILTGMKNRYALESEITDRLESDEFNCAVFDMDNFRSINDIYGYEFGDEYLAQVAEKLRNEFGDTAELYNITGNEFCFIFNKDVSYQQVIKIAQNILGVMSSVYTILNIGVQLTASGSVYHYAAGDALNVSSLLVRLDNTMRNVKRNGGNAFAEVVNM